MLGQTVSQYRIIEKLGGGGMGVVYLAEDTRLGRQVAIKFLPDKFFGDEQAITRFRREARSASALNHPHICTIYDIGEHDGHPFIVMEHLKGQTLKRGLEEKSLSTEEAIKLAVQIADALEAAHEQGILHRDIKPANIFVTERGDTKVMDFGLAKRVASEHMETELTQEGITPGTLAYMSPEQVRGQEVDARSDIFSLGVVLYEMLTGVHPFRKTQAMQTAAAIQLEKPTPIARYNDRVPDLLQHIVRKMLHKEPERRYQLTHEVKTDLKDLREGSDSDLRVPVAQRKSRGERIGWTVATAVLLLALVVVSFLYFTEPVRNSELVKLSLSLPEEMNFGALHIPAISPDGHTLAFTGGTAEGTSLLLVRSLNSLSETPLAGTEGAQQPFWSPDSQFIGFFANGRLKKIDRSGGGLQTLCDAPQARGGTWSHKGVIVFGNRRKGLYRVSEGGGSPVPVTALDESRAELGLRFPQFLPDGQHFLYVAESALTEQGRINIGSLDSPNGRELLSEYSNAVYVPPGYLLFEREGTLMAQRFEADRREIVGTAFIVAEGILNFLPFGVGHFSASQTGILIYRLGIAAGWRQRSSQMVWVDRAGNEKLVCSDMRLFGGPNISPDGTRIAVSVSQPTRQCDVWIYDLEQEKFSRLTFDAANIISRSPLWTPDGQRIVFRSLGEGRLPNLFWKAASGAGPEEQLTTSSEQQSPSSFAPDGNKLVFVATGNDGLSDLQLLDLSANRTVTPLFPSTANKHWSESFPVISPNGKWVAYSSTETDRSEVYAKPFPDVTGSKWQISKNGGTQPVWRRDGRELYYLTSTDVFADAGTASGDLMAVSVSDDTGFAFGSPKPLFKAAGYSYSYDVSPDGERFLMLKATEPTEEIAPSNELIVVLNWLEEFQDPRAPD